MKIFKLIQVENQMRKIVTEINKYIFLRKTNENRQESMNHEADKNMHFDHSG